jgi:putative NADH-flavin reductase
MKIAIIGATGGVGSRLTHEALSRGHQVSAIARKANELAGKPGLTPVALDLADAGKLAAAVAGQDAVLVSIKYHTTDGAKLLANLKKAGVKRLLAVGGAGSLQDPTGRDVVDNPEFPALWKDEALAAREFLRALRQESALDWTLISPSAMLLPGERTGKYRVGADQLLVDDKGNSGISIEDLAKALVDELEEPRHSRKRFTVGY